MLAITILLQFFTHHSFYVAAVVDLMLELFSLRPAIYIAFITSHAMSCRRWVGWLKSVRCGRTARTAAHFYSAQELMEQSSSILA